MVSKRGVKVTNQQLARFLHFIQETCPWFPEEGTVNLKTWTKVGEELKTYYCLLVPEKVTVDAFALWNIIRDVLDPQSEVSKLSQTLFSSHKRDPDERTPLSPKPNSGSLAPPLVTTIRNDDEDDWLDPEDQQKLEDEEERYEKEREERGDGPFNASNFGATGYTPSLTGITGLPSGKPPSILPPPLNHPPYHSTSEGQRHLIRKTGNISDFIRQCADIGPAYVQGVTMAATLKGETYSQFLQGVGQGPKGQKEQILENKGACFSCGLTEHFSKFCPQGNQQPYAPVLPGRPAPAAPVAPVMPGPKTICPRYQKGFHWAPGKWSGRNPPTAEKVSYRQLSKEKERKNILVP